MTEESEIIPYYLSPPPGERIIVLAPHPDDETFGCGGTVRLLRDAGKDVKVLFLTSGDKGDPSDPLSRETLSTHVTAYALLREKEAQRALRVLGVSDYEFLRYPDRELHLHSEDLLLQILKRVETYGPDTLYAPSVVELNPDHRTAAVKAMEVQRSRSGAGGSGARPVRVVFYEVTTPLRPNMLVDVTSVYGRKKRAVRRYRSQRGPVDYLRHIEALNTMRSLTVQGPRYVEAFWCTESPLGEEEMTGWLSYGR